MPWLQLLLVAGVLTPATAEFGPATPTVARLRPMPDPVPVQATLVSSGKDRVQSAELDDRVGDGIVLGALIGAGAALVFTATAYAGCDAGCEGPDPLPTYSLAAGAGAGIGAVAGWLIDRARRARAPSASVVAVAPVVSSTRKGVAVAVRF